MSKRVLVIDDNPINLRLTSYLVQKAGFVVDTADTAERGLERLAESQPDLIITDLRLPGMDGVELARAVKKNPAWSLIPVILLTAADAAEADARAHEAGCEFAISKPVDPKLFPGVIAAFLNAPPPSDDKVTDASMENLSIEDLSREFLNTGATECRGFLSAFSASRILAPLIDLDEIRRALHRWAGVGGTLGFPEITTQSHSVEDLLVASGADNPEELRQRLTSLLELFTHAVPLRQEAFRPPTLREPPPAYPARPAAKPVVLVADDDATIRTIIRLALEHAGYACRLADNGVLAFTMARNDPPDAIILDVNMPRMNGFEVLYSLRSVWCTRSVPVILLTARQTTSDVVKGVQMGAAEYMRKPFSINDLLDRLRRLI